MRHTALAVVFILFAVAAHAQDKIELYASQDRSSCNLTDNGSDILTIYAWLTGPQAARAVRFTVPKPVCWQGATWVGDIIPATSVSIGDSQTDWSVAFFAGHPECFAGFSPPVYIGAINFLTSGENFSCCRVSAHPSPYDFAYVDCDYGEHLPAIGQDVVINPNASCPCLGPVATQPSTWGRVKSLYR